MTNKVRKPLLERLKTGLEESIAYSKGTMTLKTVEVPEEPPEIDASTLTALRQQTAMSQAVFARMLNVSTKTVQSWEQGVRQPSDASRRLIQIFSEHPEMVSKTVGLPGIKLRGVRIVLMDKGHRRIVVDEKRRPKSVVRAVKTRRKKPQTV